MGDPLDYAPPISHDREVWRVDPGDPGELTPASHLGS